MSEFYYSYTILKILNILEDLFSIAHSIEVGVSRVLRKKESQALYIFDIPIGLQN